MLASKILKHENRYLANFLPEPTGIGKCSREMPIWLVAQGHEVRVAWFSGFHLLPQSPCTEDIVLPFKRSVMLASGRLVVAICRQSAE